MDILDGYVEIFAGLILFLASIYLLQSNIIDPAFEQIEINYNARADKAVTFTTSLNEAQGVHDQYVGRTPGVDPGEGIFSDKDSGLSRMYFRPEQFVLLPAVDTDISSNPNVAIGTRRNTVSRNYDVVGTRVNSAEHRGLVIGQDNFVLEKDYAITRDSLYNKQETYDSINSDGVLQKLRNLAVYSNTAFGSQAINRPTYYGGFNITVDSAVHPSSKKESNSIIFVTGRVPSK